MNQDLRSALRKIDTLILDIDHVINHYDPEFARQFSVATAQSFIELYPDIAARFDVDELTEMAVKSYKDTGCTTAWFAQKFGIDEMELYKHHHDVLCEEGGFIHSQFIKGAIRIDPDLKPLLEQVKNSGVRIVALTNGTQRYAECILKMHGVDCLFDQIHGIDSVSSHAVTGKAYGAFIRDALDKIGVLKAFNSAVKSARELRHDNVAILDDTEANLRAPFQFFGMYTTLKKTSSNKGRCEFAHHMVDDIKDYLRQIIDAKSQGQSTAPQLRLVGG